MNESDSNNSTENSSAINGNHEAKVATQGSAKMLAVQSAINAVLVGQSQVVEQVLLSLLANGHVLLEGVPGLGKTLLVRALAKTFAGDFKRIQFTPDLMPSDVTGHVVYDMQNQSFKMVPGPIFTNLLLADEINRAPAKSQAALLEVMQEKQVTTEGESRAVPLPFMVLATQNPLEQEGTYPLPEAELDRFLMKIVIDYPSHQNEVLLTELVTSNQVEDSSAVDRVEAVLSAEDLLGLMQQVAAIDIDREVTAYAVRIVQATRTHPSIFRGAGPRASIGLVRVAKAKAFMAGRTYVLPEDIKAMALPVLQHRIALTADIEIEGLSTANVLTAVLQEVEAPRQ